MSSVAIKFVVIKLPQFHNTFVKWFVSWVHDITVCVCYLAGIHAKSSFQLHDPPPDGYTPSTPWGGCHAYGRNTPREKRLHQGYPPYPPYPSCPAAKRATLYCTRHYRIGTPTSAGRWVRVELIPLTH